MGDKRNRCMYCKKYFQTPANLRRHYKIHTGEKSYSCDVCGKSFVQSGNLLIHKRIHTGEKPYECNICNKKFSQTVSLIRHKQRHTGQKPFVCGQCDKAFMRYHHLACHKRSHARRKPYKCLTCGKKFSQSGHLASHERAHSDIKTFKCNICGKRYSYESGLHKHKKTHMDGIFKCDICNKLFLNASNVKKHIKILHAVGNNFDCNAHCRNDLPARRYLNHNGTHIAVKEHTLDLLKFDIQVKVMKEPYNVLLHKTAHVTTRELPYQCDLCGKKLESTTLVDRHRGLHIAERLNEVLSQRQLKLCSDIEFKATNKSLGSSSHGIEPDVDQFVVVSDSEYESDCSQQAESDMKQEELHKCDLCERVFLSSELLTLHKKYHTGEQTTDVLSHEQLEYDLRSELGSSKPTGITYMCANCNEEFEMANELVRHYEIAHTIFYTLL